MWGSVGIFFLRCPGWMSVSRGWRGEAGDSPVSGEAVPSSLLSPCAFSEREPEKREHAGVLHIAAEKDPRLLFPPGNESHFTLCFRSNIAVYVIISSV